MTPQTALATASGAAAPRSCISAAGLGSEWVNEYKIAGVLSGVSPVLTLVFCPECDVPAEVTDRFSLPSTEGPVDHVALACAAGHHFRMPSDMLAAEAQEQLPVPRPVTARPSLTPPCWGS